jgi:hypothetical protein
MAGAGPGHRTHLEQLVEEEGVEDVYPGALGVAICAAVGSGGGGLPVPLVSLL